MGDSLTREQRAMLEGMGRSAAEMLGKRPQPSLKVARGYIAEAGDHTYDVLMPDGAVLEEVPCLISALGGNVGDEVRVEWVQGRALVTGVVATADNARYVTLFDREPPEDMAGKITLSESAANFARLIIEYVSNDGYFGSTSVSKPDGRIANLFICTPNGAANKTSILKSKCVLISGTTINTQPVYSSGKTYYRTTEQSVKPTIEYGTEVDMIAITTVIGIRA